MAFEVPKEDRCPFCDYRDAVMPCAFVTRGRLVSSFLNPAQFERGAALLIPNRHVETLLELDEELMPAIYREAQRLALGMVRAFGAVGLNVFQNNGVRAGQSVAHYHVHLVPRYSGSDPDRRFKAAEFSKIPVQDLLPIAAELRAALR